MNTLIMQGMPTLSLRQVGGNELGKPADTMDFGGGNTPDEIGEVEESTDDAGEPVEVATTTTTRDESGDWESHFPFKFTNRRTDVVLKIGRDEWTRDDMYRLRIPLQCVHRIKRLAAHFGAGALEDLIEAKLEECLIEGISHATMYYLMNIFESRGVDVEKWLGLGKNQLVTKPRRVVKKSTRARQRHLRR